MPQQKKAKTSGISGKIPILLLAVAAVVIGFISMGDYSKKGAVSVSIPALSPRAVAGQTTFNKACAQCHGQDGSGSEVGPPLIHTIYHPGHHADASFRAAIKRGSRSHHWKFGDMPPQPTITPEQTETIIVFVRAVQQASGIF
jgi:cytochrome c551/c552